MLEGNESAVIGAGTADGGTTLSVDTPAITSEPTLAGGGTPQVDAAQPQRVDFPEDWRARLAGEDQKFAKRLDRFATPADLAKSYRELETKLSQPRGKPSLPEKATPEQIAEYRREVGVPEDGKYDVELGGGFVWSDADKPVLDDFAKAAHTNNIPQSEVKKVLGWYRDHTQAQAEAQAEADATFVRESRAALQEELGVDYQRTINASGMAVQRVPEDLRYDLLLARLPSGRVLGQHPSMVKFLSAITHELNPQATIISAGPSQAANSEARMNELKTMMGDMNSAYWVGPSAEALQKEYLARVDARDRASQNAGR